MFCARFFCNRMFPARFFPKTGVAAVPTDATPSHWRRIFLNNRRNWDGHPTR